MTLPPPRWILGRAVDASVWRPAHLDLIAHQLIHRRRNAHAGMSDRDHLVAAAQWLARAQDAMSDGGIGGRYNLRGGWSSSYAETTGYIIPTLLALADELNDATFHERAERCVEFLLQLQLADGGFPGGEVHENTAQPSIFNTAQIITGLRAWHAATGDARALDAACRAADWLVAVQDADGAWRRHTYNGTVTTYTAHASCWLAELGQYMEKQAYLRSAERHLDWVLGHRDRETGWFGLPPLWWTPR